MVGVNFPEDRVLRTFPSKVNVTFQIGLSRFKEITADDFMVVVDYKDFKENETEKCTPVLVKHPHNVNHIRISPKEIDYILEQQIEFND